MTVYVDDPDFTLHHGDVLDVLPTLPDQSVHCVITSPPYWGLRDYGTGTWDGGNPDCDHDVQRWEGPKQTQGAQSGHASAADRLARSVCRCGATRVDRQLGLEETPDEYVGRMVNVFRQIRRVLRDDGTLWLNIGDSYAANVGGKPDGADTKGGVAGHVPNAWGGGSQSPVKRPDWLKPKDLVGVPWRVAFALQQPYYAGKIPNEMDRTWLAAIIDGEGSIALNYLKPSEKNDRNHDYYGPYLRVHNTNEAIVRRCAEITGVGSVKIHDSRRRPVYVWAVYGATAREVLREVYPYLVAKQHEARLAYHAPGEADCYAALKLLHKGSETIVDRPAPPSCLEPGWYLRSDIIWAKPNAMPESVTDRPTKAHEYVFLLSKQQRYWFDQEAVREPHSPDGRLVTRVVGQDGSIQHRDGERWPNGGRNVRSVWEIATQPYAEAHFATYPQELVRRCLLAGCPEWVCGTCGKPRERIVEKTTTPTQRVHNGVYDAWSGFGKSGWLPGVQDVTTTGWSDCGHDNYRPGTVLDPFMGSGTTALVARHHGRRSIGIELNADYCQLAAKRLAQQSLLAGDAAA